MANNPVIWADYPDVDIIRHGETYYMISTTMHFFPGGVILRSRDLVHWETACHVYDILDSTPARRMEKGWMYSQGMWAASLRFHDGLFHAVFSANDTHTTYHYTAESVEGTWTRRPMKGFYHDNSILFDDDGKTYIVYGNREIRLTELRSDLSEPLTGGLDRVIVRDTPPGLGYEGSHIYKIGGRYYLFLIHWPAGHMRTEAVFSADSLTGEWTGGDVLEDDMGFFRQGVAQGGIVDTPDGDWYAMLFQDHGAVGRIPVLIPVRWEDGFPKLETPPHEIHPLPERESLPCQPLFSGDDFTDPILSDVWEWNHEPDLSLVSCGAGEFRIRTGILSPDAEHCRNTLTQRTFGPGCSAEVTVKGEDLKNGDRAGFVALQGLFAEGALEREDDRYFAVLREKTDEGFSETDRIPLEGPSVRLRMSFDFRDLRDTVRFAVKTADGWKDLGSPHKLVYRLDHFTGVRVGLFCASTREAGGSAGFSAFRYAVDGE